MFPINDLQIQGKSQVNYYRSESCSPRPPDPSQIRQWRTDSSQVNGLTGPRKISSQWLLDASQVWSRGSLYPCQVSSLFPAYSGLDLRPMCYINRDTRGIGTRVSNFKEHPLRVTACPSSVVDTVYYSKVSCTIWVFVDKTYCSANNNTESTLWIPNQVLQVVNAVA